MTLLSFAVLIVVANQTGERIEDFNGLGKRSPFLAFAMLVAMISLAGVPFTAGFLGKFFIFDAAIRQHQTALVVVGVITVGVRFLLLSKSRARDVLGRHRQDRDAIPDQLAFARDNDRADGRESSCSEFIRSRS